LGFKPSRGRKQRRHPYFCRRNSPGIHYTGNKPFEGIQPFILLRENKGTKKEPAPLRGAGPPLRGEPDT